MYTVTCVKQPLSKGSILQCFRPSLSYGTINFVYKIFILSIFEWPFYTGFYCTLYLERNLEIAHVVLFSDQSNFGRGIAAVGENFVCVGEYIISV